MSPRTRSEQRERAILEASLAVFLDRGFEGATMLEIATRAKVGKGTLYGLAKSKEDLCLLAIMDRYRAMVGDLTRALQAPGDPLAVLSALVRRTVDTFEEAAPLNWLCIDLLGRSGGDDALRERILLSFRSIYGQFFAVVEALLRTASDRGQIATRDAQGIARLIAAVIDGLGYQRMIEGERLAVAPIVETFLEMLSRVLTDKRADSADTLEDQS